jgi:hypothetical protein
MTQFEISRIPFPPFPGGLTFNGPSPNFAPASSANFYISGKDDAKATQPGCSGPGASVHAVTANGLVEQELLKDKIYDGGKGDPGSYSGLGNEQVKATNPAVGVPVYPVPPGQETVAGTQYNESTLADVTDLDAYTPTDFGTTPLTPAKYPVMPDVADGSIADPYNPTAPPTLEKFDTVQENQTIVDQFAASADTLVIGDGKIGEIQSNLKYPECKGNDNEMGTDDANAPYNCQGPKITVVQGNLDLQNTRGVGILVVTGDLTLGGNFEWDGMILVIGTGKLIANGGGNKTIKGGIYLANTQGGVLGSPTVDWNGGGTGGVDYNSCNLANALQGASFRVISYREMSY